jgi:hypothetical protein
MRSQESHTVLHEPIVGESAVSHRIRSVGIPQEFLYHSGMPCDMPIGPAINQSNPFVENLRIGAPEGDVSFG